MVSAQVPLVDYLVLADPPHLRAQECTACGARYFDRRNGCAHCFGTEFRLVDVPDEGTVTAFTIVNVAAPGVPVPFVPAVVDCAGTKVRANLVNVDATPSDVHVGMKVRLATYVVGRDEAGTEAIGFGFEPVGA
jgi:uncharacterized OB-fold protein